MLLKLTLIISSAFCCATMRKKVYSDISVCSRLVLFLNISTKFNCLCLLHLQKKK